MLDDKGSAHWERQSLQIYEEGKKKESENLFVTENLGRQVRKASREF